MSMSMRLAAASGCLMLALSAGALGGDLAAIAGHYRYEQYSVKLPDNRLLSLADLGASSAFLDISEKGTITLRMTMRAGNAVTQTAKVLEAHFSGTRGYWVAQWPDMAKPVRAEIVVSDGRLTSDTRFDDPSDTARFGSVEHAVLRKEAAQ